MSDDLLPPHAIDAEMAVLGSMMLSSQWCERLSDEMTPPMFFRPAHATVFAAMVAMRGDGQPVDPLSVAHELSRRGDLVTVGGQSYLHDLVASVPSMANAGHYAGIVAKKAALRGLAETAMRAYQRAHAPGADPTDAVAQSQDEMLALSSGDTGTSMVDLGDVLGSVLEDVEQGKAGHAGVPTGFTDFDALTSGLQPGHLWVIAARPGVGKTTLVLDMLRHVAVYKKMPAAFFSLEMPRAEIAMKLLAADTRIGLHALRSGQVGPEEWERISHRLEMLSDAPLSIDDRSGLTIAQIRASARRLKQRRDLRLVAVDYLQLMSPVRRGENRQTEVSEISAGLKAMAKELEIPVIALAQLNRQSEHRAEKRPQKSDLRDSGAIEQDADGIILIHREDAVSPESSRAGEADLIVDKNRHGATGVVTVAFQGHYSRFVDMAN